MFWFCISALLCFGVPAFLLLLLVSASCFCDCGCSLFLFVVSSSAKFRQKIERVMGWMNGWMDGWMGREDADDRAGLEGQVIDGRVKQGQFKIRNNGVEWNKWARTKPIHAPIVLS
ncbi:uncharacterized protein B0T23DRAFT_30379 [Neurospora hispaniola]|uniref:Secreted protein n=1 Tax=Neurospora hispaniola TaxID=588809 RepID=A0AAJ0IGH2_9PEZI|nr:hypothetical protein B0T23DRAFT_30379 [Neurospora hispaniola]